MEGTPNFHLAIFNSLSLLIRRKSAMRKIGEKVSDKQVDGMVKEADLDKDGKVNYDEFVKVLVNKI